MNFIPAILSGGSGTRLWPLSRTRFPKQFCEIFGESLFTKTLQRLKPLGSPWVITNTNLKVLTDTALQSEGIPLTQALFEPKANNTAPAIALLCKVLEQQGRSGDVVGIFPSDHLIRNEETFRNAIGLGIECALKGQVVTLGIQPTFPATGYGYIEVTDSVFAGKNGLRALASAGFREKPDEKTASSFLASGRFYWNGGMFLFEVKTMIRHLETLMPSLWEVMKTLKSDLSNLAEVYARSPAQSIDYGVMEKLKEQVCIPCDLGWSDVGSWGEIAKLGESTETIGVSADGNFAFSNSGRLVAFVDTQDLVVVDTADAILVANKKSTEKVKQIVDTLNSSKDPRASEHPFEYRPWGRFEILRDTDAFKSKVIHVNPGHQLSYQSHAKRAEHWVIIKGQPEVVLNDVVHTLKPGESIYIPLGAKHRIRNPGKEVVEFVEVQVGSYFGEDDIVRYQDDYQR
ncbi:MAG: mannose-1-phosphate guanylyltransferase/mannose-6-phosphate isomerase [Proteobacteria bacterium]|nr:mannose-1-phosphate guanylyltransferase/mannose-6-phosphate isomerase [Pseudomonadota bacterium]